MSCWVVYLSPDPTGFTEHFLIFKTFALDQLFQQETCGHEYIQLNAGFFKELSKTKQSCGYGKVLFACYCRSKQLNISFTIRRNIKVNTNCQNICI